MLVAKQEKDAGNPLGSSLGEPSEEGERIVKPAKEPKSFSQEKAKQKNAEKEEEEGEGPSEESMLAEWENVHNKMIFDCINEVLDRMRPYGLKGPPLPWSRQVRALTFRYGEEEQIFELFEQGPGTLDFPPAQILGFSMASPVR